MMTGAVEGDENVTDHGNSVGLGGPRSGCQFRKVDVPLRDAVISYVLALHAKVAEQVLIKKLQQFICSAIARRRAPVQDRAVLLPSTGRLLRNGRSK